MLAGNEKNSELSTYYRALRILNPQSADVLAATGKSGQRPAPNGKARAMPGSK